MPKKLKKNEKITIPALPASRLPKLCLQTVQLDNSVAKRASARGKLTETSLFSFVISMVIL
jgi:hypothetical protein